MANIKQEYLNRTYQTLINSNAQRRRFQHANYGENTPIDSKQLDDVPRGKVVLSQKVFENLMKVNDESEKAQAEFSYLLTGTTEGQTIKFDNIQWCRNQGNAVEANFAPLLDNLNAYVNTAQRLGETQAIVCNGHTHPKGMSPYAEEFSLADMAGFMQMKEENPVFKNGTIDLCGGIMSDLNFNFCFYDDRMQNFYKFNDVVLELETGEQIPLSCYDRKISRSDIADKMMETIDKQPTSFRDSLRQGAPSYAEQAQFSAEFSSRGEERRRLALEYSRPDNSNERI